MKSNILYILFVLVVISSCSLKPKSPEFRSVEITEKPSYHAGDVSIKGDIILYNPNAIGFDIKDTKIDVFINQKKVTTIDQLELSEVKTKSEFSVPMDISFPSDKVYEGFLSSALGLITSKSVKFRLEGYIDFDVKGISYKHNLSHTKELSISR